MNSYIIDQKFAVESLMESIHKDEIEYSKLLEEFVELNKVFKFLYKDFTNADFNDDLNDYQVQFKFQKMAKFAQDIDLQSKKERLEKLKNQLLEKESSINSLCGSLLQIAKMGISTVHGGLDTCPSGRNIGSETLKNVIWNGRNQSLHYDEGKPRKPVKECFINLKNDFGSDFDLSVNYKVNKAGKIVKLLGWTSYKEYEKDMISLIG